MTDLVALENIGRLAFITLGIATVLAIAFLGYAVPLRMMAKKRGLPPMDMADIAVCLLATVVFLNIVGMLLALIGQNIP